MPFENYNFDFSLPKSGVPIVSLGKVGPAFNSAAVELLGRPEKVDVGFDNANCAIAVRPHVDDNNPNIACYEFLSKLRQNWIRLNMRDFMRYVSQISGIDFSDGSIQFMPEFDSKTQMLVIQVNDEHRKNKLKKGGAGEMNGT